MKLSAWQERFMSMARQVGTWSKDPSRKVGAVIVKDRRILAMGYNGFPQRIKDDQRLYDNNKNILTVHAEANAIINAAHAGVSVNGASIYVSGMCPCVECAKLIIQSGISEVIFDYFPASPKSKWRDSCLQALALFDEANVKHIQAMPLIFMLKGKKGSGKSTCAQMLCNCLNDAAIFTEICSFAAMLKRIVSKTFDISLEQLNQLKLDTAQNVFFGYNMRELLQRLGTNAMQSEFGKTIWKDMLLDHIRKSTADVIIIDDWRFKHEYIPSAITIDILGGITSDPHISENDLAGIDVDFIMDNTQHQLGENDFLSVLRMINIQGVGTATRKIKRHPSKEGSVITFDMYGKEVNLFVADAKYRTTKAWATGSTYGTDIPTLSNFTSDVNKYINPNNTGDNDTQPLPYTMSDTQLQARFPSFKTDKTAKQNTDILMGYSDTAAAHWCRSQNIFGVGQMDLPNIYELMVIYLESDRIDALDPTINEYKQYALGKLNPNGRFDFNNSIVCWSSTEYSSNNARHVDYNGYVDYYYKNGVHGVLPVKELTIEEYKKTC